MEHADEIDASPFTSRERAPTTAMLSLPEDLETFRLTLRRAVDDRIVPLNPLV
jgi:hypothetical protein